MTEQSSPVLDYVKQQAAYIEQQLNLLWTKNNLNMQTQLKDSMHYSLMAGGKRLRPTLMFAAAESLGFSNEDVLEAAIAVEMIHTYSLIHDDLPAMDNDDLRRGKPTNHVVFGDATAILAGDGLLTHAFYVISERAQSHPEEAQAVLQVSRELSLYAGPYGMVGGQAADMAGGVESLEQLEEIHKRKTGDLIVFSLRAAGILCHANDQQLAALETYGRNIGLAFQIQDDVLDVIGDQTKLGKPIHSDEESNKITYPTLIGFEQCEKWIQVLTEEAKAVILEAGFVNPRRLLELGDWLMSRDH
jgi:geranylgeranyl diphosphate synthase type II